MNDARELTIEVAGMTFDHCERSVAKALQSAGAQKYGFSAKTGLRGPDHTLDV